MPTVEKTFFEPDQVPTAAELNKVYDDLATASTALDDSNQAAGWLTYKHLDNPAANRPINNLGLAFYDGSGGPTSYNSAVWTPVVNNLGNPTEINLFYFPKSAEILRLHMSGLAGVPTVVNDYDFVGANLGKPNYYAFRIRIVYADSGGLDQNLIAGYWGYSFTTNGLNRYTTVPAQPGISINWQTFQASTIVKYTGADNVRQYKKAILEVAVFDPANTLSIVRQQLHSVRAKK
jgi:hypothetical protein